MLLSIVRGSATHLRWTVEQTEGGVVAQGPAIRHFAHSTIERRRSISRQRLRRLIAQLIQGPACLVKLHNDSILLLYDSVKLRRCLWGRIVLSRPLQVGRGLRTSDLLTC